MSDGHTAVDAMVAMLIIAMAVILTLQAVQQAGRAMALAREYRQADSLLRQVMLDAPHAFTATVGRTGGFVWQVETQATGADRPIAVCRRQVSLQNLRSHRTYKASSFEICPSTVEG